MRVLMVNQYARVLHEAGGTRHHSLARELVRRGHEVTIVASSFQHNTGRDRFAGCRTGLAVEEVVDGVRFVWLRGTPYSGNGVRRVVNMVGFALDLLRRVPRSVREIPDVVIGSSPHLLAAWAAERLASRWKTRFVFEIRDLWPETFIALGALRRGNPLALAMAGLERSLCRRARRVIIFAPRQVEYLTSRGVPAEKVVCLPNFVDLAVAGDPEPLPEGESLTALYAGAHGFVNGLGVILESASLLRGTPLGRRLRFRLVGAGPEKPALERRAAELGLDTVCFEDPVPKDRIHRLLAEADIFLIPFRDTPLYRWGLSPNKLYDYLACARPIVLGGNVAGNPVAESGAGLVVPPEDPVALAAALERLAAMTARERWEMGLRGRRCVEESYSAGVVGSRLGELITAVGREPVRKRERPGGGGVAQSPERASLGLPPAGPSA